MSKYPGIKCDQCGNEHPHCRCRPIQPTWVGFPMQLQRKWGARYGAKRPPKHFSRDVVHEVCDLIRAGYVQSSRKYTGVSLPDRSRSLDLTPAAFACFRRAARLIAWHRCIPYRRAWEAKDAARAERRAARKLLEGQTQ